MIEKVELLDFLRLKRSFLVPVDELLWSSSSINDSDNENIDEYLKIIHTECKYTFLVFVLFFNLFIKIHHQMMKYLFKLFLIVN
jgi:hypothetical protein